MKLIAVFLILLTSGLSLAQNARPVSFTDIVYKLEKKENSTRVFFVRRSAIYHIVDTEKEFLQKLEKSHKNKKRIVITADPLTQKIIEIKN